MRGETVIVDIKSPSGRDAFNALTYEPQQIEVSNVLCAPASSDDVLDSNRPDGAEVRYTLYFPKTFEQQLENTRVNVRGEWLNVIGSPNHFDASVCPTDWWMVAKVGIVHG